MYAALRYASSRDRPSSRERHLSGAERQPEVHFGRTDTEIGVIRSQSCLRVKEGESRRKAGELDTVLDTYVRIKRVKLKYTEKGREREKRARREKERERGEERQRGERIGDAKSRGNEQLTGVLQFLAVNEYTYVHSSTRDFMQREQNT